MNRVTVLLADDHALVRQGLRLLLEFGGDFEIVGEAANGRQAVDLAQKLHPTVVVMDIAMPLLNGFEATRQILRAAPATKVLALSAHDDDAHVSHMAAVGAAGYVGKQHSSQVLVHAIQEIARGHSYFRPSIFRRQRDSERKSGARGVPPAPPKRPLTPREAEVLQLVAEGAANKQIAAALGISIKTVEKHRQQLMNKLDIHDTAGLTRHAIATGVIESTSPGTTE